MSGSGPFGADAQIFWFGHPAHESAVPAFSDSGPGQDSGSGATKAGFAFMGFAKTSCTDSGSSNEGAILNSSGKSSGWRGDGLEGVKLKTRNSKSQ